MRLSQRARNLLEDIERARQRGLADGSWPEHARRGITPHPWPDPATREEWEAQARMAVCRRAAGSALSDLDRRALELCPEPGGWAGL